MNNPAPISGNNGSNIISIGAPQEQQEDINANIAQLNNANSDFAESMQSAPDLSASEIPKHIQAKQIYEAKATPLSILFYKDSLRLLKEYTRTRKAEALEIKKPEATKIYENGKKTSIQSMINCYFKKEDSSDLEKFSNIIDTALNNQENPYLKEDTLKELAEVLNIKARYESLLYLTLGKTNNGVNKAFSLKKINSDINKAFNVKIAKRQIVLAFMEYIVDKAPECGFSHEKIIDIYQALLIQASALLFNMHNRSFFTKKVNWESSIHSFITLLFVLFKNEKGESFDLDNNKKELIYDKLFCYLNSLVNTIQIFHNILSDNGINTDNCFNVSMDMRMENPEPILFGSYRFIIVRGILRILIREKYYIKGDAEFTSNFLDTIQQNMQQFHPDIAKIIEYYLESFSGFIQK